MPTLLYALNQQTITLHIRQNAKKNIILRPNDSGSLKLSIPKWLQQKELIQWLDNNHEVLQKMLQKQPFRQPENLLPEWIWFQGKPYSITLISGSQANVSEQTFRLPESWTITQQRAWLQQFLWHAARETLLSRLAQESQRLQLFPVAIDLSRAKTFWGICRARTGIRLNWRLIGAPDWVQEYVCVHELCHLVEANHSPAFWAKVQQSTPYTQAAKTWLKTHGNALFALG